MRTGATFLSAMIHAGVIAGGLFAFQAEPADVDNSTMISIPLELVTIGDKTDIAPVTEEAKIEDKAKEAETEAVASAAAAPPPEPDSVAIPEEQAKKQEEKKPEVKPAPAKSREQEVNDFIDSLALTGAKPTPAKKPSAATGNAANTTKEPPRMGAGEQRKMTASITDYIRAQLVNNRCWTDHSDMADAPRLQTTIRVWFGPNNKFSRAPELQSREPAGDPPLQVFVQHARRALDMCNTIGWIVPPEYFKLPQPAYIDITFKPSVGAMQ